MERQQQPIGGVLRSLGPLRRLHATHYGTEPTPVSKRDALSAVRGAAEALGLDPVDRQLLDAFAALSPAEDWDRGRPFVVAQNRTLMTKAGIGSERTVSRRLRRLEQLGLITRRMSGNAQRRIQRLPDDKILDAWGIDLSILQRRCEEFQALAKAHKEALARLKAEALAITARRREVVDTLDALREIGALQAASEIEAELSSLFPDHLKRTRGIERLSVADRQALSDGAERLLISAIEAFDHHADGEEFVFVAVNLSYADDADDRRHIRPESRSDSSNQRRCADAQQTHPPAMDAAYGGGSPKKGKSEVRGVNLGDEDAAGAPTASRGQRSARTMRSIALPVLKSACARFVEDHSYMPMGTWDEMFRVAEMVRHQIKVDDRLWGRTFQALGHRRDLVAALVAYVYERRHSDDPAFSLDRPQAVGGYFRRCVESAETGELNLDISIYARARRRRDPEAEAQLR